MKKCNKIKFKLNNSRLKEKECLKRRNRAKRARPKKLPLNDHFILMKF